MLKYLCTYTCTCSAPLQPCDPQGVRRIWHILVLMVYLSLRFPMFFAHVSILTYVFQCFGAFEVFGIARECPRRCQDGPWCPWEVLGSPWAIWTYVFQCFCAPVHLDVRFPNVSVPLTLSLHTCAAKSPKAKLSSTPPDGILRDSGLRAGTFKEGYRHLYCWYNILVTWYLTLDTWYLIFVLILELILALILDTYIWHLYLYTWYLYLKCLIPVLAYLILVLKVLLYSRVTHKGSGGYMHIHAYVWL